MFTICKSVFLQNKKMAVLLTILFISLSIMVGCSNSSSDNKKEDSSDNFHGAIVKNTVADLPTCDLSTEGQLFYITAILQFQYCDGNAYQNINLTGDDGTSISWQGALASAPANPSVNQAYYNTTDGIAYLYNGSSWVVLVEGTKNATISVAVSGLTGSLTLQNNGGNNLAITSNGTHSFTVKQAIGTNYFISVATQPAGQNCYPDIDAYDGIVDNDGVTVAVTCVTNGITVANAGGFVDGSVTIQVDPSTITGITSGAKIEAGIYGEEGVIAKLRGNWTSGTFSANLKPVHNWAPMMTADDMKIEPAIYTAYIFIDTNANNSFAAGEKGKLFKVQVNGNTTISYSATETSTDALISQTVAVTSLTVADASDLYCSFLLPGSPIEDIYYLTPYLFGLAWSGSPTTNGFSSTNSVANTTVSLIIAGTYDIFCFVDDNNNRISDWFEYRYYKNNVTLDGTPYSINGSDFVRY